MRGKKSDAQRELRKLLGAIDKGVAADAGKVTLGAWLGQWLEEARHNVAPKTHERYSKIVHKHLVPALGDLPLAKLAPAHIQAFYSDALKNGRLDGRGGLSPQTVLHFDRVLNRAMKGARKLRLIPINSVEDVERPKVEEREMQTLTDEEATRLLAAASTTRIYVPIVLALATGLRRGELLALHWQDIDLSTGIVEVVRSLEQTSAGLRIKTTKRSGGSDRSCCLPASSRYCATTRPSRRRNGCCLLSAKGTSCSPGLHQLGGKGGKTRRHLAYHAGARPAAYAHHESAACERAPQGRLRARGAQ